MKLKIDNGQRTLTIFKDGQDVEWKYDIVEVKIELERLELSHGLRKAGDSKVQQANTPFLVDLAKSLDSLGLKDCTKDAAFHVQNIVNAQFIAMTDQINNQVNAQLNATS